MAWSSFFPVRSGGGGRADGFQLAQQYGLQLGFGGQKEFVAAGENLLLFLQPQAQQNGAFLRKWPQMLAGGSRQPGSIPCKPRFPRAGWVSTEAKKDQGGPRRVTATPRPP